MRRSLCAVAVLATVACSTDAPGTSPAGDWVGTITTGEGLERDRATSRGFGWPSVPLSPARHPQDGQNRRASGCPW